MRKKFAIFIILLIVVFAIPITSYASGSIFTPNYIENKDFIAYTAINAATITLANGQIVSNASVIGESSLNEVPQIEDDVDIVLIIDTSDSMNDYNRIEKAKSASKKISEKFSETFVNSRIAVISFASDAILRTNSQNGGFTKEKKEVKNAIDSLVAGGMTCLPEALEFIDNPEQEKDKIIFRTEAKKAIITLTDGMVTLKPGASYNIPPHEPGADIEEYVNILNLLINERLKECQKKYREYCNKGYFVHNISLGGNYDGAFKDDLGYIGEYYGDVNEENLDSIYNSIYRDIYKEVSQTSIDTSFIFECKNAICLNNNTYFILDKEISQSALLTIEYVFDIKPNFNCTQINIVDYIGDNFCYNPNSKLLTENVTNADQGWLYSDDDSHNVYYQKTKNNVIDKYGNLKLKIVLTKLIVYSDEEDNIFENHIDFSLYEGENLKYSTETPGQELQKLKSAVYIIPPLGSTLNYNYIKIVLAILIIILIIVFCIIKNRKK